MGPELFLALILFMGPKVFLVGISRGTDLDISKKNLTCDFYN